MLENLADCEEKHLLISMMKGISQYTLVTTRTMVAQLL